jgi:2-amino-4-hydroxy-6-hydroxymethyldihydropteridine diphosphokinase
LLDRLLEIERELGRERREKWSPRRIDLDLLLYGDQVIETESLVIPHPLMHTRQFVLKPLAEIAPDLVHPTLKATMKELWINISLE